MGLLTRSERIVCSRVATHFKATIPKGFTDFKHCIPCSDVGTKNDEFNLKTNLSRGDAVSTLFKFLSVYRICKVCLTGLFFGDEQIIFYNNKASNGQGFWLDNGQKCGHLENDNFYFVKEINIKNMKVSTACDAN